MPSITRRSNSLACCALLAVISVVLVAPAASAAPSARALPSEGFFWSLVVDTWNSLLEGVFSPTSMVLDPNGLSQDGETGEPPSPASDATLDGSAA